MTASAAIVCAVTARTCVERPPEVLDSEQRRAPQTTGRRIVAAAATAYTGAVVPSSSAKLRGRWPVL